MAFDDTRSTHAGDDATGLACRALRTVEKVRKVTRLSVAMADAAHLAKVVLDDVLTVTGLSVLRLSELIGIPERTLASWFDVDHASDPPLALLFALPPDARDAALSLAEIRTMSAATSRGVVEQVAWMHERLAAVSAAYRDGRPHDALKAWHAMAGDHRGLGVLLARGVER